LTLPDGGPTGTPVTDRGADLPVDPGRPDLEGAFPEMARANAAFARQIARRPMTVGGLFDAARRLEQAYARHGYVLARVTIPPQQLAPGRPLRVVITDGFIEAVDVSALSPARRGMVMARLQPLVGRRHITQAAIERALLLASDLPGAHLRSALTRGDQSGGARLIVEGHFDRFNGALGIDNTLPASLGTWAVNASLAANGLLGLGDQLYGFAGAQPALGRYGFPNSPFGVLGGGLTVPLGHGGVTLNGEAVVSRTQPAPQPGVPVTVGNFTRLQLRLAVPVVRTRRETLRLTGTFAAIRQTLRAPDFDLALNRDSYRALRIGAEWHHQLPGVQTGLDLLLSHGLGGRDGTLALPLSRQGADSHFTTLAATARVGVGLPQDLHLNLVARGQAAFGQPQMLSEQFTLDGPEAASTLPSGSASVDQGLTLRAEAGHTLPPILRGAVIEHYLFAAQGWGWLNAASAVEPRFTTLHAFGMGARFALTGKPGASLNVELGMTGGHARPDGARVNVSTAVRF
jgi:hemolysin activation/secretion protein